MENPPTSLNKLKDEIEQEKYKYIKKYISKQDYWMVWQYICTGRLADKAWINDTQ